MVLVVVATDCFGGGFGGRRGPRSTGWRGAVHPGGGEGVTCATTVQYTGMEAGCTSTVSGMSCLGTNTMASGIDTNVAEYMVEYLCPG